MVTLSGHGPETIIQFKSLLEFVLHMTRFPCLFWVAVQTIQNPNRFFKATKATHDTTHFPCHSSTQICHLLHFQRLAGSLKGRCFLPSLMSTHLFTHNSVMLPTSCLLRLIASYPQLTSWTPLITNGKLVPNVYVGNIFLGHFSMTQNKLYNLYCLWALKNKIT